MSLAEDLGYAESKPDQVNIPSQDNDLGSKLGYSAVPDQVKSKEESAKDYFLAQAGLDEKSQKADAENRNAIYLSQLDMLGDVARIGAKGIDVALGTQLEKGFKEHVAGRRAEYEKGETGGLAYILGSIATPLGVAGKAVKGAGLLAGAARGGLTGLAAGVTAYKPDAESIADYAIPMAVGTLAGGLAGGVAGVVGRALQPFTKAKEVSKELTGNEVRVLSKDVGDDIFRQLPSIGEEAQRFEQNAEIREVFKGVIKNIALDSKGVIGSKELTENMTKKAFKFLERTKLREAELYKPLTEKGGKVLVSGAKNTIASIKGAYKDEIARSGMFKTVLNKIGDKDLTWNQIKELRTTLREVGSKKFKQDVTDLNFQEMYDSAYTRLTNLMRDGAKQAGMSKEFFRANNYSRMRNELSERGGTTLKRAIENEHDTLKFVNSFFKETKTVAGTKAEIAPINIAERKRLGGAVLNQAFRRSIDSAGNLELNSFLKATANLPDWKPMMNSNTYQRMLGIQRVAEMARTSQKMTGSSVQSATAMSMGSKLLGNVMSNDRNPLGKLFLSIARSARDSKLLPHLMKQVESQAGKAGVRITSDPAGNITVDLKE